MIAPGVSGGLVMRRVAWFMPALLLLAGCKGGGAVATSSPPSGGAPASSSPAPPPGSPGAITRAEFVARANEICKAGNARQSAIPSPDNTVAQQLAYLDQVIAATAETLRQIRALPQPPGDRATLQQMYAKGDAALSVARQESAALKEGKTSVAAALDTQLATATNEVNSAFSAYGLIFCGSA